MPVVPRIEVALPLVPPAWLIPGQVAVLFPLTPPLPPEANGAHLKQPEHIQTFQFRAGPTKNGAEENLQPHSVHQVIAGSSTDSAQRSLAEFCS